MSVSGTYAPKILRVNLTTGTSSLEPIPQSIILQYVGGRGFGVKYLFDELAPDTDPYSPDNKLIFSIGPLAGTGALSFSRWIVSTKSPLTGTYFRSVGGANFGAWLRFAGIDVLMIEGKSNEPKYLYLENGLCELKSAGELWGKNTAETQKSLQDLYGRSVCVACIGPAGEKMVRYASIHSDRRSASRGGCGAVMGSKNLKAIAIRASRQTNKIGDPEAFKSLIKEQATGIESDKTIRGYRDFGTMPNLEITNLLGVFPTRNFRQGTLRGWEEISSESYAKIKVKDNGCYACPVKCGKSYEIKAGAYANSTNEGPEYESAWAFAGSTGTTDIGATVAADALCDDLGLDTVSTGVTIGFAYELFEKGIIDSTDTDGLQLTYGNHQAAIQLIRKIGSREGFGDVLAEGSRLAATRIGKGAASYAMQTKGLELPGYEPRGLKRQGLAYATSPIGASHNLAFIVQEIFGIPHPRKIDRFADQGGADLVKLAQDRVAMWETGVACSFAQPRMRLFTAMLSTITGVAEFSSAEFLFKVGERIFNLERVFNNREGIRRDSDVLPLRMTTEPLTDAGPSEGQIIRNWVALLDEYYQHRGWDENGVPTQDKLKELNLI